MKYLIMNKLLTIPAVFLVIISLFGGTIAEIIISETNLSIWINTNKIDNSFRGLDFSFLPGLVMLVASFVLAVIVQLIAEHFFEAWEYFSATPVNKINEAGNQTSVVPDMDDSAKKEPTLGSMSDAEDKGKGDEK
ncbi:hypothetical protein FP371_24335 [Citrobacter freundii]|nr:MULTISPECIES: hypothetical protein [Enterobacteriaceae]EEA2350414.1 hypothetical protein [Salmonella enterica subsp. enterica serovar Enteritidis]EEC4304192.1 hypothetical protein [Salmonella enterica subsp. enterica serovar Enteritidis]EEN2406616.1 hypothetical protein [Salmonella enterica subsp. enterica serovar Enteritidis]EES8921232.1 hypothetical protein [Escherichia coli]EES9863011.1 hypothetical protein [Escherichia coli]